MRNLKLALRTLFKTPFVTAIAVVSLALGIGANAAIFSLIDQILLQALPVREPERLVNLSAPGEKTGSQSCGQAGSCEEIFSYPLFRDLERAQTAFSGVAAHVIFGANLAFKGQTMNGEGVLVSGSYFPVLGVAPALGRLISPADDQAVGAHPVAVLSYRYWETRLGGDRGVLDQAIVINGQPLTIIGVAPRGFDGATLGSQPQVFVPITMRGVLMGAHARHAGFENRRSHWAYLFARLKPGVTIEQAQRAVNAVFKPIINDVEAPLQSGMSPQTLAQFRAREIVLAEGRRGQSSMHREARTPLLMLLAITGIVLLIACANIANLLLARAANRATEMAVRLALGASRRQLLAQLLTESVLLALLGGAASLVVARWTMSGIVSMLPGEAAALLLPEIRPSVVLFAAAISLGTGLLFGMFPALNATRPDLVTSLRAGSGKQSSSRGAARFRTSLVTAQIALSMMLLVSAGLFIRSLVNLSRVDLGLQADNVVTFRISPELNGYTPVRSRALFRQVEEELAALPGVAAVAASRVPLLSNNSTGSNMSVEGFRPDPDADTEANFNVIGPGFFRTLGIPLRSGREFTEADGLGTGKVAIVNEAFARKFNLGREAVGKHMTPGAGDVKLDIQIVGVVQDAKYSKVKDEIPPQFFVPYRQDSTIGAINYYVRTALEPRQLLRTIPAVMKRLDPNLPVEELKTLPQQVRENVVVDRLISTLAATFAALATLLAAVGLYGVLAYTVAQRTREIGVRMALGADGRRVRGMVLKQVAIMTAIGGAIGIGAALGLGQAAQSMLYGLQGYDPLAVVAAAVVLALVAFGAGYIPALRASRVHPMQALRYE